MVVHVLVAHKGTYKNSKKMLEITHIHQIINRHQQIVQKNCKTKKLETNLTNCSNKPSRLITLSFVHKNEATPTSKEL